MTDRELERDLENRFTYHVSSERQIPMYEEIRQAGHTFATMIVGYAPESRERSIALRKIEEAVMWANAAIARHDG